MMSVISPLPEDLDVCGCPLRIQIYRLVGLCRCCSRLSSRRLPCLVLLPQEVEQLASHGKEVGGCLLEDRNERLKYSSSLTTL